jgi:serine/threonine protein kinase
MFSRLISFFSSSSSAPSSNEESAHVCVASLAFPPSSEMTCNAYRLCWAAPLTVDVESAPVQFRLCNASASHERSFTVSVLPDALRYVVCLLEPQHGVLRAGADVVVRLSLKLLCTTRVDVPVDVCVDGQFARCRVIVDAASGASERLDPDRVELLDRDRPLGAGGYGTVYRAKYAAQVIAAKVINEQNALHMSDEQVRRFEHEVTLLARVRHECIVHFIGASHFPGRFMICTELLPLGAVGDLIESAAPPSLALCRRFAIDLARALVYLHQQPIIYRDVKSDNLLACSLDVDAPVNCVPEDHEILTSRGFLDLDAYKAAVAADPTLLVASYNVAAKTLVFEAPLRLVQFAAETRELVELSNVDEMQNACDSHVSMLVTKEHDVFAQLGNAFVDENGTTTVTPDSSYAKHQAGDLLKSEFNVVGQLAVAEAGVQGETVPDFCDELGLSTPEQRALFYEIYGFWLGDGSLRWHGQEFAVTFVEEAWLEESLTALEVPFIKSDLSQTGQATISIQSDAWNRVFAAEYQHMYERADAVAKRAKTELTTKVDAEGRAFDTVSTAKGSYMQPEGIAKWFACWVWRLGAASLRRVLAGLCRADGDATKNRCIWTSSARFRDEIQRVCLMAGCTAHFRCAGGSSWAVSFAEPDGSPSSENACKPNLFKARGEIRTRQHTGRVWCFTMPSGFIWVRRVAKDEHGVVTEASRPLITGNCKLIDFGIARTVKSASKARRYTTRFGSIPYMAPEVIDDQPYCARVDVYAAGIVMAELVMRRHAWHDANLWQLPSRVMNGARPTMPPTTPRAWAQLAQACWAPAPADRPTAAQLLDSLCALQGLFN